MLKLLKTILHAGEPTVKYPFAPLEVCPGFRGKPELDPLQCIACGACTSACPANALTMETVSEENRRVWQLFIGRCIYCGRCEEVCPTRAIRLSEEFELAVTHKADLYVRATLRLQHCRECGVPFAPEKSVALAVELLALNQNAPQQVEHLRAQASLCPACRRRAALEHRGSVNVHYYLKEQA
ncbi:hydrogenase 4 subunit H [Enterobacter sp. Bisph1]|uniref:hydrogenase 4 subunit H n=1 Tax=Enterobacter sp. Bisph1 TaxID=1274399 RepID=UPI00057C160A|nr:hydrogenase 4 subunit H [Enterobacter sp. Bisph1]